MMKKWKRNVLMVTLIFFAWGSGAYAQEAERKPFGEWVEILKAEHEADLKAHSDLEAIEIGAALHCKLSLHNWHYETDQTKFPHATENLTATGKRYYDAFVAFKESTRGKAMINAYKETGTLLPEDMAYYFVIKGYVDPYPFHKGRGIPDGKAKLAEMNKVNTAFVTKLFKGESVTRAEIKRFREFIAIVPKGGTAMHWPAKDFSWSRGDLYEKYDSPYPVQGQKVPDLRFHYFETLAEQTGFRPGTYTCTLQAYMTPTILESSLLVFDSYTYGTKDGKEVLSPATDDFEKLNPDEFFSLHEQIKKGRPIYLMRHNITDTTDYVRRVGHQEALYWLFKDQVDFFHVTRLNFDVGCTEYFGARYDAFSSLYPAEKKLVQDDFPIPETFYSSRGNLAAVPKGFMRLPTKSVPVLLNIGARVKEYGWGIPQNLIDKNGISCQVETAPGKGIVSPNQILHNTKMIAVYRDHKISASVKPDSLMLRNSIRLFKILETLGWEYDAGSELLQNHYDKIKNVSYLEFADFAFKNATLLELDMENRVLRLRGKIKGLNKKSEEKEFSVQIGKRPYIASKGLRLADFQAGDQIDLTCKPAPNNLEKLQLQSLSKRGVESTGSGRLGHADGTFFSGTITAIDLESYTCTVAMPKPDAARGEWKGFAIYEEFEPLGLQEPSSRETKESWAFCKKLYYGSDADRTFVLHIDDDVDFSVNGRFAGLEQASVGDRLVFALSMLGGGRKTDAHPHYSPAAVYVIKNGPLTD